MIRDLESAIAEKKAEAAKIREQAAELIRDAEHLEAVIEGMEEARRYYDSASTAAVSRQRSESKPTERRSSGGRQPGAISRRWVDVYHYIWKKHGGDFDIPAIGLAVAELEGREIRAAEARRQVENHAKHGLVTRVFDLTDDTPRYSVTDTTAERYGFGPRPSHENEASDSGEASNENGAPDGAPETPQSETALPVLTDTE